MGAPWKLAISSDATWFRQGTSAAALLVCGAATLPAQAVPVVTSASGVDVAAVQSAVDAFRASLGTLNPNVAGSFGSGRREINWDGVPDAVSSPNPFPSTFFNIE